MKQKKPELLAPAGNMEKLKMAILYGADAVYLGGEKYGLRAQGGNFSQQEMAEAVRSLKLSGCSDNKYGKIKSIAGLSFFSNLEDLDLSDNQISDISDLSELRHLKKLRLKNNVSKANLKCCHFVWSSKIRKTTQINYCCFFKIEITIPIIKHINRNILDI